VHPILADPETQGPENAPEPLKKYAMLLSGDQDGGGHRGGTIVPGNRNHVQDIVKVRSDRAFSPVIYSDSIPGHH
jgi:hypothetical protein